MADPREVFWTLQDANSEGDAPHVRVDGEASANQKGLIGFAFKDSSGNVVLPQLDSSGRIIVTSDTGTLMRAPGELAAGSLTLAAVTGADLTLTAGKTYAKIGMLCSSRRDSLFQLIHSNDSVEAVLLEVILGPGQFTFQAALPDDEFVAGATGPQELLVKAQNFDKESSLRATIVASELP